MGGREGREDGRKVGAFFCVGVEGSFFVAPPPTPPTVQKQGRDPLKK